MNIPGPRTTGTPRSPRNMPGPASRGNPARTWKPIKLVDLINQKEAVKHRTFAGWEIVPATVRLCLMNLFLHNIGEMDGEPPVTRMDSLISDWGRKFDYVLTNPPWVPMPKPFWIAPGTRRPPRTRGT